MQPLTMNELVKAQLEAAGFKVKLAVMDWNALLDLTRLGRAKAPEIDGINISRSLQDPFSALIRAAPGSRLSQARHPTSAACSQGAASRHAAPM